MTVMQGLAGFLDVRIVTEKTVWAMPECSIGLFPDVGFASMASRCMPLELALFLALTGTRLSAAADLIGSGVGTHFVPSSQVSFLKESLENAQFSRSFEEAQSQMNGVFAHDDVAPAVQTTCHVMNHASAVADVVKAHAAIPDSNEAHLMPNMALISKHFSRAVQCLEASGSPVQAVQALYQSLKFQVKSCLVTVGGSGLFHVPNYACDLLCFYCSVHVPFVTG